jgi:PAS domain S-box-containing protein
MSGPAKAGFRAATPQWLAAIVEGTGDAIVSGDLDGTIVSWNDGAARLYGYAQSEIVGSPILTLVSADHQAAEQDVLARLRRGEQLGPYDTVHHHKDGTLLDLSVSGAAVRSADGDIIGTSMIARDNADHRRAQAQHATLRSEMGHRMRNLFAVAGSLVALSARFAQTPADVTEKVRSRLDALARAHDLTLPARADVADRPENRATLHALIRTILSPYDDIDGHDEKRVHISGDDVSIGGSAVTGFALLLHELAMNAAKFGALSSPTGRVDVVSRADGEALYVAWQERGGPRIDARERREGFGTFMSDVTARRQLGGEIIRDWNAEGLAIQLTVPLNRLIT